MCMSTDTDRKKVEKTKENIANMTKKLSEDANAVGYTTHT